MATVMGGTRGGSSPRASRCGSGAIRRMKATRKRFGIGLAGFVVLMLLGLGGVADGDKDRLISSDKGETSTGIIKQGVVGRVTSLDGSPVEGAFIQARSLDVFAPPIPEIAILSDPDGRYTWPLLPGTYELSVTAEGYKPATGRVTVEAAKVATLDVTLEKVL
jgi:Carboxypeptidase regulatory-like domain